MKSNWGRLKKQDLGTGRGKGGSEGLEMEIGPNKERLLRMLLFGDDWKKKPTQPLQEGQRPGQRL